MQVLHSLASVDFTSLAFILQDQQSVPSAEDGGGVLGALGRAAEWFIGLFQAGGVFSLTGTLWDSNDEETATLLANEPLFVGTVSAFEVIESFWNPNRIDLGASITPTGGWLKDNGYLVAMDYALIMFGVECRQDGGDLVDFTGNLTTYGAGGFQFTIIPEPSTAALLGGSMAVLAMGRRKRGGWRSI